MLRAYPLGLLDKASNYIAQPPPWQEFASLVVFFLVFLLILTWMIVIGKGKDRSLNLPLAIILSLLILIDFGLLVSMVQGSC